jgi:phage tail-like protein
MDDDQAVSRYLDYLPAIFRQDPFLGRFLLAFETVLTGRPPDRPGLETTIGRIADYLDPATADADFLPWLAGWVGLSLRADWSEATKRGFVRQIVPLYRLRGTPAGLQQILELYTGEQGRVEVVDDFDDVPHYFQVRITLSEADPVLLRRKQQIARAIIDQEKPAYAFYGLQLSTRTMRLVSRDLQQRETTEDYTPPLLILGSNTLLGTENRRL